jgi:branched-chain amino acid aminotransferase
LIGHKWFVPLIYLILILVLKFNYYGVHIDIQKTTESRIGQTDFDNILFGHVFADHMFIVDYEESQWKNPRIKPYGPLQLNPALSALHYGQSIFEGMKAYRKADGHLLLFRPEENWIRLNESAQRMCMPTLPKDIFMDGLRNWLVLDADWVPSDKDHSLYIRPFMFATDDHLGVRPSSKYSFIIYGCPVSAYYTEPLRIKIEDYYVRAVGGGVGYAKTCGNYAAAMYPTHLAQKAGFHQSLWTDAIEHKYLEELGTSNFFAVIDNKLITPELSETILKGITRDSVIQLAKDSEIKVEERPFEAIELINAFNKGKLTEAFATGTAANVAPIEHLQYKGEDMRLNVDGNTVASMLKKKLDSLKRGFTPDTRGWLVEV